MMGLMKCSRILFKVLLENSSSIKHFFIGDRVSIPRVLCGNL